MPALPDHTLNDGTTLPAVGLGTYALRGIPGAEGMAEALRRGYRLLDSAVNYENEGAVGKAVRMSGVPREEIRVTSKLPGRHHKKPNVTWAIEESLLRSGLDYLDLYLIHWPNPSQQLFVEAWEGMIEAMSASSSWKPAMSRFSARRDGVADFGIGSTPSWVCQRRTTCAGVRPCFFAAATTCGSARRPVPLPIGVQAWVRMPRCLSAARCSGWLK